MATCKNGKALHRCACHTLKVGNDWRSVLESLVAPEENTFCKRANKMSKLSMIAFRNHGAKNDGETPGQFDRRLADFDEAGLSG
jgi:hypothetical protein